MRRWHPGALSGPRITPFPGWALKGGTALNPFVFELPWLSVNIDTWRSKPVAVNVWRRAPVG